MVQSLQASNPSRILSALPELLDSQRDSFNLFLKEGIAKELSKLSPIRVENKNVIAELILDGENYQLVSPKENPRECILKMKTYDCKLYVKGQIVYKTFAGTILHKTKSEWLLIAHLPLMTKRGHFIINGSPRVIVQQVVRCPGIYFQEMPDKDSNKKTRFYADIIPKRGVWLRVQVTKKGEIQAKFKKGKKIQAEILQKCLQVIERQEKLKSLGSTYENLSNVLSHPSSWVLTPILNGVISTNLINAYVKRQTFLNEACIIRKRKQAELGIEDGTFSYTYEKLYRPAEDKEAEQLATKNDNDAADLAFKAQKCYTNLFSTFKIESRYDLSDLGREKINTKFGITLSETQLTALDLQNTRFWLQKYSKGEKRVDDIDHSKNRRIRTSGSLLQSQFEIGIDRLKKFTWNKLKEFINVQLTEAESLEVAGSISSAITTYPFDELADLPFVSESREKYPTGYLLQSKNLDHFLPQRGVATTLADFESQHSSAINTVKFSLKVASQLASNRLVLPFSIYKKSSRKLKSSQITTLFNSICVLPFVAQKQEKLQSKKFLDSAAWKPFRLDVKDQNFENQNLSNYTFNLYRKIQLSLSKKENISLKNIVSAKPLTGAFREFFGSNPLSQYMDQTNPLAEITHKRRISSLGIGGVSRDSAGMAIRGIHATHYGRICPIETPEGKNAGLVNSLSFFAKVDSNGFIKTPYYKLFKGQVQNELGFSFFSAEQETAHNFFIAPSDLQKSSNNILQNNSVAVRVADNLLDLFKKIHPYAVDCIGISPIQMISVATSLIPFLEHNDANRALMGSNMQRQAVPLMIPERPLVGTGLESLVLAESGHITQSKITGFISYVSCNKIIVESLNNFKHCSALLLHNNSYQNASVKLVQELASASWKKNNEGVTNTKLTALAASKLALTENLINLRKSQAFVIHNSDQVSPFGITIRKKVKRKKPSKRGLGYAKTAWLAKSFPKLGFYQARKNYLLSDQNEGLVKPDQVKPTFNTFSFAKSESKGQLVGSLKGLSLRKKTKRKFLNSEFTPSSHLIQNFNRSNQDICLVERALVQEGEWVQQGDILTDCSASEKGELAVGKNVLLAYLPWEGYNFEDAIVISDRLVKENVYTSLHIERYDFDAQDFKEGNEWFTNDLPGIASKNVKHLDEFGLPKIGSFVKEGDILVGKIKYSNKKATTPYERLLCDILGEKNFAARDASLYLPRGVEARVIHHQLIGFFDKNSTVRSKEQLGNLATPSSKNKLPKVVNIFLGEKRPIQVGDKMSGRHGNKGVVSTILPRQDMPYLADGTPIDVILNPLGVPSRMNVGQVFECLLGLAATYLAQHFKITPFDETYGVEASQSLVYLKLYQARLQSGQNWLFQVDFPGKTRLIDGRSGEAFDQWVTVGKAYMLKLIHMVNEKIHARSTGPYALITQQPLRGRSQKGGQRLGEMEVWALQGFGAAYTLQELLTKKSDDTIGRKEIAACILPRPVSILETVSNTFAQAEAKLLQTKGPLNFNAYTASGFANANSDPLDTPFGGQGSGSLDSNAFQASGQKSKANSGVFTETQFMTSQSSNTLYGNREAANRESEKGYRNQNKLLLGQPEIFKVLVCELQALCLDIGLYTLTNKSFQRSFITAI